MVEEGVEMACGSERGMECTMCVGSGGGGRRRVLHAEKCCSMCGVKLMESSRGIGREVVRVCVL